MINNRNGSVSVETSIAFVFFILFFISIMLLCKLARAQVIVQHAVNQTAAEISKYSYIVNKFQLIEAKDTNEAVAKTDNLINEVGNIYQVINTEKDRIQNNFYSNIFDSLKVYKKRDNNGNILDNYYDILNNTGNVLYSNFKEYLKDPKGLISGFVEIAKDEVSNYAISKFILSPMCKELFQKYLPKSNNAEDDLLKKIGVKNGINGVNFDASTIFIDGKTVNIVALYKMTIDMPFLIKKDFIFKVSSSTPSWGSEIYGDGDNLKKNDNTNNIWDIDWRDRTSEFIKIIKKERGLISVRIPIPLDFYDEKNNELIYVHSMNTTMKSYCDTDSGDLNLEQIKKAIKTYCDSAVENAKKTNKIVVEDGDEKILNRAKNIKVIMVVHKDTIGKADELNKIINEIKKELAMNSLDIELYYSDGKV